MTPRTFALMIGVLLVLLGALSFVPQLTYYETSPLRIAAGANFNQFLKLLPISPALNILHLALGAWGIASFRSTRAAVIYARIAALILLVFTVFGFMPGADRLFGLAPFYGNNVWLHGLLALTAAPLGWFYRVGPALPAPHAFVMPPPPMPPPSPPPPAGEPEAPFANFWEY